jgi:hypothetical protein
MILASIDIALFELPSLEEIQEMDRQRLQAIESLERR